MTDITREEFYAQQGENARKIAGICLRKKKEKAAYWNKGIEEKDIIADAALNALQAVYDKYDSSREAAPGEKRKLKNFIYTAVRNQVSDLLCKENEALKHSGITSGVEVDTTWEEMRQAASDFYMGELKLRLKYAIGQLKPMEQAVLEFYLEDPKTYVKESSAALKITENQVSVQKSRALKKLPDLMRNTPPAYLARYTERQVSRGFTLGFMTVKAPEPKTVNFVYPKFDLDATVLLLLDKLRGANEGRSAAQKSDFFVKEISSSAVYKIEENNNRLIQFSMPHKLFTKSAFKQALICPTGQYYYYNDKAYANQNITDDFLKSLAEGGFQVGEIAKVYYGIDEAHCIEPLDYKTSLDATANFFKQNKVNIAEAAFKWGNCFVRTDILVKDGHDIQLIEVKAKSWNPAEDKFVTEKKETKKGSGEMKSLEKEVKTDIREYVYDVAFQKYVVTNALKELYPDEEFNVKAYLMMADKSKVADIDGINQMFIITKDPVTGRTGAKRTQDACQLASCTHVVTPFDVDELCDLIIAGKTAEQADYMGCRFQDFVKEKSEAYVANKKICTPVGDKCFKCPFRKSDADPAGMKDGYVECWKSEAGFTDSDFSRPLVEDLWGAYIRRGDFIKDGKYFLDDLEDDDIKPAEKKAKKSDQKPTPPAPGLSHIDRKWLQIGMWTGKEDILKRFGDEIEGDVYLAKDELKARMEEWVYPLHMIDFETTAVALPFYKGMRPYEQVAFQFSHHIIRKNGDGSYSIEHAGQFINTQKGHFPNFDFIRELKRQLDKDNGTIFRYAAHENTILRAIHDQLAESNEQDKDELMAWIDSITHYTDENKTVISGERDMEDLCAIVKSYYYHKSMKGSNSIKAVLPAVLNSSDFIKKKYSQPIYGRDIPSLNIPATDPIPWITYDTDGVTVKNPYKLLPSVGSYIGIDDDLLDRQGDPDDEMTVANGGSALTAYSKLQFSDSVTSAALEKALLRYCELDTMAMVFIWEYFYHEIFE